MCSVGTISSANLASPKIQNSHRFSLGYSLRTGHCKLLVLVVDPSLDLVAITLLYIFHVVFLACVLCKVSFVYRLQYQ